MIQTENERSIIIEDNRSMELALDDVFCKSLKVVNGEVRDLETS